MSDAAGRTLLDDSAGKIENADTRSVGSKLADEAALIWGSTGSIWDGIKAGAHNLYENPGVAIVAVSSGIAAGALAALPYGRAIVWGATALGLERMVSPEVTRVWNDASALPEAQRDLGLKVGVTLSYVPLAGLGSVGGVRMGQLLNPTAQIPLWTSGLRSTPLGAHWGEDTNLGEFAPYEYKQHPGNSSRHPWPF